MRRLSAILALLGLMCLMAVALLTSQNTAPPAHPTAAIATSTATATATPKPTATPQPTATPRPAPTPTPQPPPQGSVSITMNYPAGSIPDLMVFLESTTNPSDYYFEQFGSGSSIFKLVMDGIPPGVYYLFACKIPYSPGVPAESEGAYTVNTTTYGDNNHTMIPVSVFPGQTTFGPTVNDWYAPWGTFPACP